MLALALLVLNHVTVIDMHVHALFPPLGDDDSPLPWSDRDTSLALLRTLLLHGVTTVRDPGGATEAAIAVRGMLAARRDRGSGALHRGVKAE